MIQSYLKWNFLLFSSQREEKSGFTSAREEQRGTEAPGAFHIPSLVAFILIFSLVTIAYSLLSTTDKAKRLLYVIGLRKNG